MRDRAINKSCRNFHYRGLRVGVCSSDLSHLSWLEEFLSPHFEVVDGLSCDYRVTLTIDTRRYVEILRKGPHPSGEQVACFALDSSLVQLPLWRPDGENQVVFEKAFKAFYLVNQDKNEVSILTPAKNISARTALMRVVREIAMNHSQQTGALIIHGAAFVKANQGVIIAGPKKAGKTTLLMHVLQQGAVHFVSNDRVVAFFDETRPILRGMPTIVTLRQQTLRKFPHLHGRLLDSSYQHELSVGETAEQVRQPVRLPQDGRWSLSPAQFGELLQVFAIAESQVCTLLFPRVTGASGAIQLEELSADEAAVRLRGGLFRANSCQKTADVFALCGNGPSLDRSTLDSLCRRLTSRVRCFECQLGREAYQGEGSAISLLDRVMG